MKIINANLITEKNKLSTSSVWLTLLQVEVSDTTTIYLVPNPQSVTFDGHTYNPFPCKIEPVRSDAKGGLNEVVVSVSNVTREISAYVEANDLRGRTVRLIGVNSANLSDPTAKVFDEEYIITEIDITEQLVNFRLGHVRFLQQNFPGSRFFRDNCRWVYKSTECGYSGGMTSCDKILEDSNGCRAHGNQSRFGGFPVLPSPRYV
ncbi:MAG: hypothetical protein IT393_07330 [Nitrospirae bacterium]|nr:hypothetical protein [Nitrospirota bacterium]